MARLNDLFHIPVSRIRLDYDDMWPEQMKHASVAWHMQHFLQRGAPHRPVDLVLVEHRFLIDNGRHRIEAAKRLKRHPNLGQLQRGRG